MAIKNIFYKPNINNYLENIKQTVSKEDIVAKYIREEKSVFLYRGTLGNAAASDGESAQR